MLQAGGRGVGGHRVGSCPSSGQAPQQHQQQPSVPCCCAGAQGEERCRRCAGGCVLTAPPLLLNSSQDGAAGPLRPVDGDRPRAAPADCEPSAPLSRSPGKLLAGSPCTGSSACVCVRVCVCCSCLSWCCRREGRCVWKAHGGTVGYNQHDAEAKPWAQK